jgi:hypothetical protein
MKRVAEYGPGVWGDEDKGLHLDLPVILAHFRLPNTRENRDMVVRLAAEIFRKHNPTCKIVETKDPDEA